MTPWNKGKHTGIAPWKGKKRDPVTMEKIAVKNRGKKRSSEVCAAITKRMMGHATSEETRQKISKAHKGVPLSPEHIATMKGKHIITDEVRKRLASYRLGKKHSLKHRKMMSEKMRGSNGAGWKGGITPLHMAIRSLFEYNEWRKSCFIRDEYKCKCGARANGVHHIIPFYKLFADFLKQYSQFSPIEDKETLTRLAVSYAPFWDIDNGVAICKECHNKTDSHGHHGKILKKRNYAGSFI
jgi:hypothetical protein